MEWKEKYPKYFQDRSANELNYKEISLDYEMFKDDFKLQREYEYLKDRIRLELLYCLSD